MKGKALLGHFGPPKWYLRAKKGERKGAFWAIWVEKGRVTMKIIPFGGLKGAGEGRHLSPLRQLRL